MGVLEQVFVPNGEVDALYVYQLVAGSRICDMKSILL